MIDQTADKLGRGGRPLGRARRRGGALLRALVWLLILGAVAAGVYWIVWGRQPATQPGPRGRFGATMTMPVTTTPAARADMPIRLAALGTVTPMATVTVRTQVSGQLTQIAFKEGQAVQKGDFLAEIDPRPYQAQLEQALGQLQRDQALLRNAEVDLQRYRTLVAQNSIARQQLDTTEALVRQYQGTVKADQGVVDNARVNLGYTRITAPISGRVGLRQVDQGNFVQASDATGLVVITQVQPITVIFTIPESSLPMVLRRVRGGAELEVAAYDRSGQIRLAVGKLTTIDNQIDTTTGTVKLRAQFDNLDEALFPNQFVNVQLLVDTQRDATVLPLSAIQRGAPGTFVYVVQPDSTVTVKPVKLGPADAERVAIAEGLQVGDRVVTDGADKLREGAKVMLPEEAAARGGAPGAGTPPAEGRRGPRGEGQGRPGGEGQGRPDGAPRGERRGPP